MKHTEKCIKKSILKIDFDNKLFLFFDDFLEKYERIKNLLDFKIVSILIYKSRSGYHIELYLDKKISNYDIVFYQLLFSSDYVREIFNLKRIKRNERRWNILYDGKYDNKKEKFIRRKFLFKKSVELLGYIRKIDEEDKNDE